jgi:hypothetical protein
MSNERDSNGEEGEALGDEEPTKVEVGGAYVIGAGRRLAVALHGAGHGVDAALDVVESAPGTGALAALEEIEEYLANLGPTIEGALRAVRRIKAEARRNGT